MSIIEQARAEMERAGFETEDAAAMLDILGRFFERWDSGGAVWAMAPVLIRLLAGQPLSPLTGADDEWHDPMGDEQMLQNVRCSSVFKIKDQHMSGLFRKIYDIDNPSWDGTFPYDPVTKFPADPVIEVDTGTAALANGDCR